MNTNNKTLKIVSVFILIISIMILGIFTISKVFGGTFDISITNNPSAANGKGGLNLDWSMYSSTDTVYKVFKKAEEESQYQPISTIDLENQEETVKVLNVYPNIPASNTLKTWMETNGYGKGKISVTPISMDTFNTNPSGYLKNFTSDWSYDVVVFGTWDVNRWADITVEAANTIRQYHNSGRGILFGHDTVLKDYNNNFFSIRDLINIEDGSGTPYLTKIKIKKTGLLTNYPYDLMNQDGFLTVPESHTTNQTANGDIWMDYADYGSGKNNFYLTTWKNAAMIQTGHSDGAATDDEQRLFANILFYLKQITTVKNRTDNSAQDLANPNKPTFSSFNKFGNNIGRINLNTTDNGTPYSYYVESYNKSNTSVLIDRSVEKTGVSATGVKGYYYIFDNNKTLNFNKNTAGVQYTTNKYIDIPNYSSQYLHVFAIDGAGNVGPIADIGPKVDISGTIEYIEKDNYQAKRPESVNVNLYQNNVLIKTLKATDTFDFGSLEKKDVNGTDFNYKITQTGIDQNVYLSEISKVGDIVFKIVNTLIDYPEISLTIDKKIDFKNLDDSLLKNKINNKSFNIVLTDQNTGKPIKFSVKPNKPILLSNLMAGHTYKITEFNYSNLIFGGFTLNTNHSAYKLIYKNGEYLLTIINNLKDDIVIGINSNSEININQLVEDGIYKENLIKLK